MPDEQLLAAVAARFRHYSTERLIDRIEKAPDFGYDDESVELSRRLAADGKTWRWTPGDRIEITDRKDTP